MGWNYIPCYELADLACFMRAMLSCNLRENDSKFEIASSLNSWSARLKSSVYGRLRVFPSLTGTWTWVAAWALATYHISFVMFGRNHSIILSLIPLVKSSLAHKMFDVYRQQDNTKDQVYKL